MRPYREGPVVDEPLQRRRVWRPWMSRLGYVILIVAGPVVWIGGPLIPARSDVGAIMAAVYVVVAALAAVFVALPPTSWEKTPLVKRLLTFVWWPLSLIVLGGWYLVRWVARGE